MAATSRNRRKRKGEALTRDVPVRDVVNPGIEQVLLEPHRPHKRVSLPLIRSKGPKVKLTNERIYDFVEFP